MFKFVANKVLENAEPNVKIVGFLGFTGFLSFYYIWHYIFPQEYENFSLRLLSSIIFFPYIFYDKIPNKLKLYFPQYFLITLTIALPYSFTFMLIKNRFSDIWTFSLIVQMYLLIILVSEIEAFLAMTLVGTFMAIISCLLIDGYVSTELLKIDYIPIVIFALFSGVICNYQKDKNNIQKIRISKSLAGSIAHEVRNPLNFINLARYQIENLAQNLSINKNNFTQSNLDQELIKLTSEISNTIKRANEIINITLTGLKGEKINSASFVVLNCADLVNKAIAEYGYNNENERGIIKNQISVENNFNFKGDETLFIYILFNLFKNSLHYLKTISDLKILVYTKIEKNNNILCIEDNGPGIPKNIINKIFQEFNSHKENGTGLGLSFCKRIINSFEGEIECESELNKFTRFNLIFPKKIDNLQITATTQKQQILVYFNDESKFSFLKKIIEDELGKKCQMFSKLKNLLNNVNAEENDQIIIIAVDNFTNEEESIVKKIKQKSKSIILLFSNTKNNKIIKENHVNIDEIIDEYDNKFIVTKIISKWLDIRYDPFYKKTIEEIRSILTNKKILVVDDEITNRIILSRIISNLGVKTDSAQNGQEMLDKYFEKQKNNEFYDAIVSDMNMPIMSGDQASAKIREYEKNNNIKSTTIIAYTGYDQKEFLYNLFRCGINDYFIKGVENEYLLRTIAFWISATSQNK